ncbi:MAG: type II toxin-antitoxin system prevent-host-death family antitoxin [Sulfurimonas sp.]|nr:type II toxin-antitoxin system prevent-host-death family antitoxin [Sulfurimonas sp.]
MQAVNYTNARNKLKDIIDEVCDKNEEVIVTTKNNKSVVILSLDTYNATHTRLKQEIAQAMQEIEKGDFVEIDEAFELAKKTYRA